MDSGSKELLSRVARNMNANRFIKLITTLLFLVLAAAFFVSVKYSMLMDENFFIKNKSNSGLKEYKKNFLIVMYHTSDNFLGRFQSAILEEAEKRQIRIDYVNVESITEAIDSINTAVAAKMDGIIAQGFYNEDYIEAINNAIEKGLAVQFVYTDARGTDRSYFVGYNAYDFGKKAARCAIEELPGLRGNIALLVQSVTNDEKDVTSSLTIEGFKSVIDKLPMIKLVDIVRTSYDLFSAEDIIYDIINRYPHIDAIICTSEKDTFGAAQVIIDLNRVGDIKLIGVGLSEDILRYIDLRIIAASFDMNPELMSKKALDIMLEDKAASDYVEIPVTMVTSDNAYLFAR